MSFERLLKPRSIATFGGANAQEVIRQSDLMGYKGEIWPVHPKKAEILGRPVYRSVEDLPGSPDAAYVGVNRYLTIDIVSRGQCFGPISRVVNGLTRAWLSSPCRRTWDSTSPCSGVVYPLPT